MSHTHPCPDCGKLFTCTASGQGCAKHIAKQRKLYPCAGATFRPSKDESSGLYFCLHCGEADLPADQMEPMRDGEPSGMCKQCWFESEMRRKDETQENMARWHQASVDEVREGERRARMKKMGKNEKAKVENARTERYLPGEIEWN